jgi:hypothetical protein
MLEGSVSLWGGGENITPSDASDLVKNSRGLLVCGAGTLRITTMNGEVLNFSAVPAFGFIPYIVKKVHATGTTATGIMGGR